MPSKRPGKFICTPAVRRLLSERGKKGGSRKSLKKREACIQTGLNRKYPPPDKASVFEIGGMPINPNGKRSPKNSGPPVDAKDFRCENCQNSLIASSHTHDRMKSGKDMRWECQNCGHMQTLTPLRYFGVEYFHAPPPPPKDSP